MALQTATISSKILSPKLAASYKIEVVIEATSVDGILKDTATGDLIGGVHRASTQSDGTLTVADLPKLPQAGIEPADARWRATFRLIDPPWDKKISAPAPVDFELTADVKWGDLVDVSGVPVTQSLVALVNAARDATLAARDQAQTAAASVQREQASGVAGLTAAGKLYEARIPDRLSDASLTATNAPLAARPLALARRQPPLALSGATTSTPAITSPIGLLADGVTKVFANSGFSASQIGRSTDGGNYTWGKDLEGGNGVANGFIETPGGEVLVGVAHRDSTPGKLWRSTGWNPTTMDATSWTAVLTASGAGDSFDGRWGCTQRSVAPLASAGQGAIFVSEYGTTISNAATSAEAAVRAWMSTDDGATWTQIFDLRDRGASGQAHVHAIAYDKYDDRVWITVGDNANAAIYYADRESINGTSTTWTLLTGSNSGTYQSTTVIPLALGIVLLSDASDSAVFRVPRKGYRAYGAIRMAVDLPGTGLIGAHAYQAADDLPTYLTFYNSSSGQTPMIVATVDGRHFSTVHTDTGTVTTGPGIHSIVGPDLDGNLWAVRNLTGSGSLLKVSALRASSGVQTTRLISTGPGLTGGGDLTADRTLRVVSWDSPLRRGLVGQVGPEELFTSTTALTGGTMVVMKVVAEDDAASATRTVRIYQGGAATGQTSMQAAVFDSTGAQLGSTSASDAGAASSHRNLTVGSFALVKGQEYYVALLFVGTTGPSLARSLGANAQTRMGLSGATLLFATAGTGLTAIPASITPGSLANLDTAFWAGLL